MQYNIQAMKIQKAHITGHLSKGAKVNEGDNWSKSIPA